MTTKNANLEGRWILKSGVGLQLLLDTTITIEFKDGKLSGKGGCNQYNASFTVEPLDGTSGKIQIQGITSTEIFCGEEINAQESEYFQALEQVSEYNLTDEGLVLPYPSPSRYLLFTPMKTQVFEVQDIEISHPENTQASLKAVGTVNTAGWKDAELIKRPSSYDGKLEFDFVAQPPDSPVAQVITPIEAVYRLSEEEQGNNHFIVYASRNQKEIFMEEKKMETLHGLVLTDISATITVTSNGCTNKDDFKIELTKSLPPIATFIRVNPDNCKMAEHSIDLVFSLKEVGAAEFKVANPFVLAPARLNG